MRYLLSTVAVVGVMLTGAVTVSAQTLADLAKREAEQRTELAVAADVLVTVPILDEPINDLAGLVRLGETCWR